MWIARRPIAVRYKLSYELWTLYISRDVYNLRIKWTRIHRIIKWGKPTWTKDTSSLLGPFWRCTCRTGKGITMQRRIYRIIQIDIGPNSIHDYMYLLISNFTWDILPQKLKKPAKPPEMFQSRRYSLYRNTFWNAYRRPFLFYFLL